MDLEIFEEYFDWSMARRGRQIIFSYINADKEFGIYLVKPLSIAQYYNSKTLMLNCIYRFGEKQKKIEKNYPPRDWSEPLILNFSIKNIINVVKVPFWNWRYGMSTNPELTFKDYKDKV